MRRAIRALGLAGLLGFEGALPGGWTAAATTELKVMSFNIWVQGGRSLDQCIEAIRQSGADLVGLQECNPATARTMATALGFQVQPDGGVSILSRHPIVRSIPVGGGRGATIEVGPGQRVHLFNCHLTAYPYGPYRLREGWSRPAVLDEEHRVRMPALNALLAGMKPFLEGTDPVFLTGDFNAPSHLDYADFPWPTSVAPTEAGMIDAYRERHPGNATYPPAFAFDAPGITWTPIVAEEPHDAFDRIDLVYYAGGRGIECVAATELDERNSVRPWPSDHRAVLATFRLPAPPGREETASRPEPADGAKGLPARVALSWVPALRTVTQSVHFGTSPPGTAGSPQTATFFEPPPLEPETTYFWRIDGQGPDGVVEGPTWSFRTGSFPRVIPDREVYGIGEPIEIRFTAGPGGARDWIGLYREGSGYGAGAPSLDWFYVDGTRQGGLAGRREPSGSPAAWAHPGTTRRASLPTTATNCWRRRRSK